MMGKRRVIGNSKVEHIYEVKVRKNKVYFYFNKIAEYSQMWIRRYYKRPPTSRWTPLFAAKTALTNRSMNSTSWFVAYCTKLDVKAMQPTHKC